MNLNLIGRVIGLSAAIAFLAFSGALPHLVLISLFLVAFGVHYTSDLEGDDFFLDEPIGVAITRHLGFAAAIITGIVAVLTNASVQATVWGFALSLTTHLVGDALSVKRAIMAFDIQEYVKLPAFMQFVGMFAAAIVIGTSGHAVSKLFGFVSLGLAFAGFLYEKIYQ